MITKAELVSDLKKLGVKPGDILNVKCSMRSLGKVDGGAATLISALLEAVGEDGTIVTDSFIKVYKPHVAAKKPLVDEKSASYCGVLANEMLKYPGVERSRHPVQKFAAIGKYAKEFCENHTDESYAYNILRLMALKGGKNLKIGSDEQIPGVGTTHVAIGMLKLKNRRPYLGVCYMKNGKKTFFRRDWAGICAHSFNKFLPYYEKSGDIIARGKVGNADSMLTSMYGTLKTEYYILKKNPAFLDCGDPFCIDCQLNWQYSRGTKIGFILKALIHGKLSKAIFVARMFYKKYVELPDGESKLPPDDFAE